MKLLIEGREAAIEERTRSAMLMQKQAVEAGWAVKIGYSKFQDDDRTYKTGQKAGTTVEGKVVDNVWAQGFKGGHIFTVVWQNNKLDHCLFDNRIISMKDLKEKL